jgi:predicted anti-sigma-YlaC factor YlaD
MTLPRDRFGILLLVFGLISLGNAAWMLGNPLGWYHDLPAEVPDFGPFNPHFVRDIGCAFVTIGVALVWAALVPTRRFALTMVAVVFYAAHAVLHVFDTLRGAVELDHVLLDFPGVYLPAILLLVAAWVVRRHEGVE